jgi:hypothetical protein
MPYLEVLRDAVDVLDGAAVVHDLVPHLGRPQPALDQVPVDMTPCQASLKTEAASRSRG